ncbi:MAG: type II toxin-antitoxin system PemK/MazF family toxin [Verrucomicrobiota bacterium]|jgi:mRNA interferase MazF
MNKWDIVILRYPFTDLMVTKARPALVISPDSCRPGEDAVFIAITSNSTGKGPFDILISNSDPEFSACGLRCSSVIKIDKIFTLKKTLVARNLGRLGSALKSQVEAQLRRFLELR